MQLVSNGQLATSAAAIYTGVSSVQCVVTCQNTSTNTAQTIVLTLTPTSGTARRVARAVLAANEQLVVSGVPLSSGDVLMGHTTTATTVDYLVSTTSTDIPYTVASLDANGAVKQVNTGIVGDQTIGGTATVGTALAPDTADGATLGTNTLTFSDLFLAEGGTINWDDGDAVITQTNNTIAFSGISATTSSGSILSTAPTGGIGYTTGAGGTAVQASTRTTNVAVNTVAGSITLVSAAGSATPFSFTVQNSAVGANDVIHLSQKSGTDIYTTQVVSAVAAGSFRLTLANASGTTTETPVFSFAVIKGVTS